MKLDLKKELPSYRARRGAFEVIDVPRMRYLMIDGHGDPNTPAFEDALTTLYSVAYPLKFRSKKESDRDYVVMPLEALWWADDMWSFTMDRDKSRWDWTAMILTPDWITETSSPERRRGPRRPRSTDCAWSRSMRAGASRSCTSGRTTTKGRCSIACTTSSCRRTGCG